MVRGCDLYQKRKGRVYALPNCSGVSLTRRTSFSPQDASTAEGVRQMIRNPDPLTWI